MVFTRAKSICRLGFLIFSVALNLSACKTVSQNGATSSSSLNPAVNQSGGFYVNFVPPDVDYPYYFHEQSSLSSPCVVPQGTTGAASDIFCILDANELDLYFNPTNITYNVPQSMCEYFRLMPYDYLDFQPGWGTPVITVTTTNGVQETVSPAGALDTSGNPTCTYDYTTLTPPGPDCCGGTWEIDSLETTTNVHTKTTGSYSGNPSACLSGPAVDLQPKDLNGFPEPSIYRSSVDGGVTGTLSMVSPISKQFGGNVYISNYFNPSLLGSGSSSFPPNPGTAMPTALIDVAAPSPTTGYATVVQPYYDFGCLDNANDYIARIRLLVRSWDTVAGFTADSNPYTAGNQPVFGKPWHDRSVWEDYPTSYPQQNQ